MARNPQELAKSLYAGTFDPYDDEALKLLNDAHEKMAQENNRVGEIRKLATIIYRSDVPLNKPEVSRALAMARDTLYVDLQILGGAAGAAETVPMAIIDTMNLVISSEARHQFMEGLQNLVTDPMATLSRSSRNAMADIYASKDPSFEIGRHEGHLITNLAIGVAAGKSAVQRFTKTEAPPKVSPSPNFGKVTTYEEQPFVKNAAVVRTVTRYDLGEGYAVHVAEDVGQGSRVTLEIPDGGRQKIMVEVPKEVWHEHNYYMDMNKAISNLETRLKQIGGVDAELVELKEARMPIEETYRSAMDAALQLEGDVKTAGKYALFLARREGFRFPEDISPAHTQDLNLEP